MKIDTSFARAALVLPKEFKQASFYIIGAGGTGSFAALSVARLCFELRERGKAVELTIIDPDRVETNNIPRSNFCQAEIGRFKAQTLAERISGAWSLEVGYACESFDYDKHIKPNASGYKQTTILVGCVDNHLARRELHRALQKCEPYFSAEAPRAWWVDGGNGKFSGQVLIGSTVKIGVTEDYFATPTICRRLPAPSVFHPELLEPEKAVPLPRDSGAARSAASCPELVRLGEQSLNINSRVAIEIGEILSALLITNSLKRFAAYFDLESGTSRSLYCTPETIEKALIEAARNVKAAKPKKRKKSNARTRATPFYAG